MNKLKNNEIEIEKEKNLKSHILLILYFFLFAFLGWLLETFYSYTQLGHFVKRGFLYGPICPIYGFGAIILLQFLNKYRKNSLKLFVFSAIIFSAFEYIVGFILDALFAAKWWDYSNDFLNLNGRISILYSIVWGTIAILFINHIFPFLEKYTTKLWEKFSFIIQKIVIITLSTIFIIDEVFSFIKYLK